MRNHQRLSVETVNGAYGLEVAVDDIHGMQVLQSACRFCELQEYFNIRGFVEERRSGAPDEGD